MLCSAADRILFGHDEADQYRLLITRTRGTGQTEQTWSFDDARHLQSASTVAENKLSLFSLSLPPSSRINWLPLRLVSVVVSRIRRVYGLPM